MQKGKSAIRENAENHGSRTGQSHTQRGKPFCTGEDFSNTFLKTKMKLNNPLLGLNE